jgi:hypothetical protein
VTSSGLWIILGEGGPGQVGGLGGSRDRLYGEAQRQDTISEGRPDKAEVNMKRIALAGRVFGFAVILATSLGLPHRVAAAPPGALKALDTDNDGTVDLAEAKAAGSKLFDKLDRDHDGTLDRRELRGHMVSKEFGAADGDHDGTLDKDEYLAAVEKSFKAADRDSDGTLDAKELGSARGRALLRLLK